MKSHAALLSRLFLILLMMQLGAACTVRSWESQPQTGLLPVPDEKKLTAEEEKAGLIWHSFSVKASNAEGLSGPFRIAANLRYSDETGENTRVSALLWGNGKQNSPYPLRLDLVAGIGTVVAKIQEDADKFTAYSPDEKTAYTHAGDNSSLTSFGVPIPLTLGDLTLLLTGRCGRLFLPVGPRSVDVPPFMNLSDNGASFTLAGARLPGILELSSSGAPLKWRELKEDGWVIGMEPSKKNPLQPEKLRISHPLGYSALITVKEVSRVSPPYNSAQLHLALPPGTKVKAMEQD